MANIDILKGRLVEIEIGREVGLFPSIGLYAEDLAYAVKLHTPTVVNIGTTTATIGCTSSSVGVGDILYWFVSTSATPPSEGDLIAGTGAVDYGSDVTPLAGANTFNATGLASVTTYYSYFYQTSDNGNSLIIESGSWATLDPSDLLAAACTLNSLASTTSTSITANVTSPNDVDHGTCLFYYKEIGSIAYISGGQGITTQNTTATFDITGLVSGTTYDVVVIARDTAYKQSLPSNQLSVTVGTVQSEDEQFLTNLEEILSQCATFQTWTSTANKTDAKAFIYKRWSDSPAGKYCVINGTSDDDKISNNGFIANAELIATFTDSVSLNYENRDSQATASAFLVTMGKIKAELRLLTKIGQLLTIEDIKINEPEFSSPEDEDKTIETEFNITTGV